MNWPSSKSNSQSEKCIQVLIIISDFECPASARSKTVAMMSSSMVKWNRWQSLFRETLEKYPRQHHACYYSNTWGSDWRSGLTPLTLLPKLETQCGKKHLTAEAAWRRWHYYPNFKPNAGRNTWLQKRPDAADITTRNWNSMRETTLDWHETLNEMMTLRWFLQSVAFVF